MPIIRILSIILILAKAGHAQMTDSVKSVFVTGLRSHYGFVIKHSKALSNLKNSYPWGIQTDVCWHYISQKAWDFCNCYPKIGISLYYWNYNNSLELGNGIVTIGYIEPFFGFHRKFSYSLRTGAGLAYLDKPYDSLSNPNNMAYSTNISFPLFIYNTFSYKLKKNIVLNISASYNHISNTGIKQPNKGLNYPTICLGMDYYFDPPPSFEKKGKTNWKELSPLKNSYCFSFLSAIKQVGHVDYTKYLIWGLSVKFSRKIARLSAINAGIEWLDHGAVKEILRQKNIYDISHCKGGILAGHEFILGKFIFSQQFGIYWYDPSKLDDPVYQRYGLYYKISKNIFTEINLLAHRHIADFMDIRIGYYMNK